MSALIDSPSLFLRLTGIENVLLLARLSAPLRRADAERALARVGLARDAGRPAGDYSLGMKQRLALAVALAASPEVLILDEPTNGLDPEGIHDLRRMLLELHAGGMTILLSSHLLSEVEKCATRIGVMRSGAMVVEGPVADVLGGPTVVEVVARPLARAREILARFGETAVDGRALRVTMPDGAVAPAVRALVEAGIEVDSCAPRRSSLEALVVGGAR
jgi:ABC-2 type transport system ATP-binding protein